MIEGIPAQAEAEGGARGKTGLTWRRGVQRKGTRKSSVLLGWAIIRSRCSRSFPCAILEHVALLSRNPLPQSESFQKIYIEPWRNCQRFNFLSFHHDTKVWVKNKFTFHEINASCRYSIHFKKNLLVHKRRGQERVPSDRCCVEERVNMYPPKSVSQKSDSTISHRTFGSVKLNFVVNNLFGISGIFSSAPGKTKGYCFFEG